MLGPFSRQLRSGGFSGANQPRSGRAAREVFAGQGVWVASTRESA